MSDLSFSSCSSGNNEENEQINLCCILDCVYCLMVIHHNTFTDEKNRKKREEIQSACTSCLIKVLKFYKVFIYKYFIINDIFIILIQN